MKRKHRVGLDISDHKMRLVGIAQRYGRLRIQMFAEIDLPAGAIVNGSIIDAAVVSSTLRELGKHSSPIPWRGHEVYMGLPEQHTFISSIWLPNITKDEADREARKLLPLEADQMYYDVEVQRGLKLASLAASRREVVDQYLAVLETANYTVVGIHSEAEAVARALVPQTEAAVGHIIIDLGTARTTVAFYMFNSVFFSTTYPSVLTPTGLQQNNLAAVMQQLQHYYGEHYNETAPLTKIVLCGSGAYVPNVVTWLKTLTTVVVELGDPLQHFKPTHTSKRLDRPLVFTTAIGLALQK